MNETVKLVLDFINQTATALTPMAEKTFAIYIKQAHADGIANLIIAGIGLLLFIAGIALIIMAIKSSSFDSDVIGTIGFIACVASLFIMAIFLTLGIKYIINPEYYAIQDFLQTIK